MRKKLEHTCERCGHQTMIPRAGRFNDDDYIELLHEHLELEDVHRRELARLQQEIAKLRWLIDDLTASSDRWQALAIGWRRECEEEAETTAKYPAE